AGNSLSSSYIFYHSYGVNHGDGTGLLYLLAGVLVGTASFTINFLGPYFSPWLQRGVSDMTFSRLQTIFPGIKRHTADESKKYLKWATTEVPFWVGPILMMEYAPDMAQCWAQHLSATP